MGDRVAAALDTLEEAIKAAEASSTPLSEDELSRLDSLRHRVMKLTAVAPPPKPVLGAHKSSVLSANIDELTAMQESDGGFDEV